MTTSKQFEQAYNIFSTMEKVKLTTKKGKGKLFTIEYFMPSFDPQNESVHMQHALMFKNDKFTFNAQKDLVLSMPYQFVFNLQPGGQFTPLDNKCHRNLFFLSKIELHQTNQACDAIKGKLRWKLYH